MSTRYGDQEGSRFITNLTLPAPQVWNLYRHWADAENRIKELKYDFGFISFNVRSFYGTEAALNMVMMAYNLMSLFRQVSMDSKVHPKLSTLRYRLFAIGHEACRISVYECFLSNSLKWSEAFILPG